jgi:uncharacterized coiled-coil protein SlyX
MGGESRPFDSPGPSSCNPVAWVVMVNERGWMQAQEFSMAEPEDLQVDPNLAGEAELSRLPGIGPAMARRIIASRPYRSPIDLTRVSGLGEKSLAQLLPFLTLPPEPGDAPAAQLAVSPDQPRRRSTPPGVTPARRRVDYFSRSETVYLAAASGLIGALLAVVLTLSLLAGLNGTLDFSRHRVIRELATELDGSAGRLSRLESELVSVQARLDALQGLSGRIADAQTQINALETDMDQALNEVHDMQSSVSNLEQVIGDVQARVSLFDRFLAGLRELLLEPTDGAQGSMTP